MRASTINRWVLLALFSGETTPDRPGAIETRDDLTQAEGKHMYFTSEAYI